ncbi:hypothetical protein BT69DRAFT_1275531 [Atractiella rhizophila]|nr:hypothetical protein BT69DRAFT_1275531 [Atractiella rhizophila]
MSRFFLLWCCWTSLLRIFAYAQFAPPLPSRSLLLNPIDQPIRFTPSGLLTLAFSGQKKNIFTGGRGVPDGTAVSSADVLNDEPSASFTPSRNATISGGALSFVTLLTMSSMNSSYVLLWKSVTALRGPENNGSYAIEWGEGWMEWESPDEQSSSFVSLLLPASSVPESRTAFVLPAEPLAASSFYSSSGMGKMTANRPGSGNAALKGGDSGAATVQVPAYLPMVMALLVLISSL